VVGTASERPQHSIIVTFGFVFTLNTILLFRLFTY